MIYTLKTPRLGFRQWQESDRAPYRAMNADPKVMEFFPATMTHEEVDAMIIRMTDHINEHGFGFFAVDRLDTNEFIGFIGIGFPRYELGFGRFLEIGWRTVPSSWGLGLATEGARALLKFAFEELAFKEVYSMTAIQNKRSERVMQKIGMRLDGIFDHPMLPADSVLLKHVLYKVTPDDI